MVASSFLTTALLAFATVVASQQCYGIDGSALDKTFTPCNPNAEHSACCASGDVCLSNGLCMSTEDVTVGMIFSRGCTDATGKDTACPQQCSGGKYGLVLEYKYLASDYLLSSHQTQHHTITTPTSMATPNLRHGRILLPGRGLHQKLLQQCSRPPDPRASPRHPAIPAGAHFQRQCSFSSANPTCNSQPRDIHEPSRRRIHLRRRPSPLDHHRGNARRAPRRHHRQLHHHHRVAAQARAPPAPPQRTLRNTDVQDKCLPQSPRVVCRLRETQYGG